jgi:hypothetical protein
MLMTQYENAYARTDRTDGLGFGSGTVGARSPIWRIHADSSAASTSSGAIDCEILENNSREEEIEEQCHENARLSNPSDPVHHNLFLELPSSAQTETGSGKAISNYLYFHY